MRIVFGRLPFMNPHSERVLTLFPILLRHVLCNSLSRSFPYHIHQYLISVSLTILRLFINYSQHHLP